MSGSWIAAIAGRLLRKSTFERLVSPAIADLQLEASNGLSFRLRHYVAIVCVLVSAVGCDVCTDLAGGFSADARRAVWRPAFLWSLAAFAVSIWIGKREPIEVLGPAAAAASLLRALLTAPRNALYVAMTAPAFYFTRRSSSSPHGLLSRLPLR
jgi:hypothetical protein